jgi:hypothetical protein
MKPYTGKKVFHHLSLTWAFRVKCGSCVNTLAHNQTMVGYAYNMYNLFETKARIEDLSMINVNNYINGK